MSSRTLDIADAIVAVLNAADWSVDLSAERKYIPSFKISELEGGAKVAVVPKARAREYLTRDQDELQYQIDIGVFQHCPGSEAERDLIADAMIAIVEDIELYWKRREIILGSDSIMMISSEAAPIYDTGMLKESGVFGSVITMTFEGAL